NARGCRSSFHGASARREHARPRWRSGDDLRIERRVAIGDVGIELHARLRAVFGVVVSAGLAMSAGAEELAIRPRRVAVAPYPGERLGVNGVDQTGER